MKKIFAFAILFAAVSMVACGGEQKKANEAEEAAATECCGECAAEEACTEECCGECTAEGECEKTECCGECAAEEAPAAEVVAE
ncbi:MAG: hypothetical protein IKW36_00720 [Alistipes sp.]|nr:hypothetical protein [Alistipes sp.]MBR5584750.1 hypothetical protein [Alistipes sp.]